MSDFIRVYDNALSSDFCDEFVKTFDQSPHLKQGTTSGGVDLSKKVSHDLYLNSYPDYAKQLQHIQQVTAKHLFEYLEEHFFMIIGAFGLKVYHPKTGEPVDLTVSRSVLEAKHSKFLELLKDLHRCEPRVVSLQEAADQLELQVDHNSSSF